MGNKRCGVPCVGAVVAWLLGLAFAQIPNTSSGTTTIVEPCPVETGIINTPAELERLIECIASSGNRAKGDFNITWTDVDPMSPDLDFPNLTQIDGNVAFLDLRSADNANAKAITITADSLQAISGQLAFVDMPMLNMPSFPNLALADAIVFEDVTFTGPSSFGAQTFKTLSQISTMSFTNTNIADIGNGWDPDFKPILGNSRFSLAAVGNRNLTSLTLGGYQAANIHIEDNNVDLSVELRGLQGCTLNLQGVAAFSAPDLRQVGLDGAIGGGLNGTAAQTSAAPAGKLYKRQEDGDSDSDTAMNTISGNSFQELRLERLDTIVGPFNLSNNSGLQTIAFPSLANIFGQVDMSGEVLDSVEVATPINFQEDGQLALELSSAQACDAAPLQQPPSIACQQIKVEPPPSTGDDDAGESDNDDKEGSSGGLSTGAKAGIGVGIGLGISLLLLLAFFVYRRRSRKARSSASRTARSMGSDLPYSKDSAVSPSEATTASPARYSKVPSELRTEEIRRPVSGMSFDQPARVSVDRGYSRSGSRGGLDQPVHQANAIELEEQQGERFGMEEQQGMRHEMDARSLPDIDLDDDDLERRSLDDIERSRNSGPPIGVALSGSHGPVSPIGR